MGHPRADLLPETVPPPGAAWPKVAAFALSFDGYACRGQELGRWANGIVRAFHRKGALGQALSLADLRALLYFEQRCFHHFGTSPDGRDRTCIDALLVAIRAQVPDADRHAG
jgi:hypothetical protein